MHVTMTVNGEEIQREIEPRVLLVHFLRENLGMTGTHWGCDTSNCGACVVLLAEALLDRVELTSDLEPLDGPDLVAGGGRRQQRARLDGLAVHQHDTRAAVRRVAAPMRAGKTELVAQEVHEQHPRLDLAGVLLAVDRHRNLHHASPRSARSVARRSARCVNSCTT